MQNLISKKCYFLHKILSKLKIELFIYILDLQWVGNSPEFEEWKINTKNDTFMSCTRNSVSFLEKGNMVLEKMPQFAKLIQ